MKFILVKFFGSVYQSRWNVTRHFRCLVPIHTATVLDSTSLRNGRNFEI